MQTRLLRFFKWFAYIKLAFGRTQNHLGFALNVMDKLLLIAVLLAVEDKLVWWQMGLLAVIVFLVFVFVGHWDLKKGVAKVESSLSNSHNPEIQELLILHTKIDYLIKKLGGDIDESGAKKRSEYIQAFKV